MKSYIVWLVIFTAFLKSTVAAADSVGFIFDKNFPPSQIVSSRLDQLPSNSHIDAVYRYGIEDCQQVLSAVEDAISRGGRGVILFSGCEWSLPSAVEAASQAGVFTVITGSDSLLTGLSNADRSFLLSFPKLDTNQLTGEFRDFGDQFFGWCADVDLPDLEQGKPSPPLGTCLSSAGVPDGVTTIDAAMLAAIDLMVQLIDGSTVTVLQSTFGDLAYDPNTRSFRLPGQIALDVDSPAFQTYEQQQQPLNFPEDILGQLCPNCSGSGPICARGDTCPKECGKNNCTKTGDKTCCNSAGMPAPEY